MALFKFPYTTGNMTMRVAAADAAARTRQKESERKGKGYTSHTFRESLCEPSSRKGEIYGPALYTSGVFTYKRFLRDECLLLHTCILQVCESTCWNLWAFRVYSLTSKPIHWSLQIVEQHLDPVAVQHRPTIVNGTETFRSKIFFLYAPSRYVVLLSFPLPLSLSLFYSVIWTVRLAVSQRTTRLRDQNEQIFLSSLNHVCLPPFYRVVYRLRSLQPAPRRERNHIAWWSGTRGSQSYKRRNSDYL